MYIDFSKGRWSEEKVMTAYTFRFTETPPFIQEQDHIRSGVNPDHPEGFDNISLLTRDTYTAGVTVTARCGFQGTGCPEILLVPEAELCPDGATRYGACFEIVLYENGINVWRHYRENGECFWHQRLGVEYPVAEDAVHELRVQALKDELIIWLNGQKTILHTEDIPPKFHIGLTACEGIARLYDLKIEA